MTLNDIYTNERACELRQLANALPSHMRNGNMDELARSVSRINKLSDELVNRLHDLESRKGRSSPKWGWLKYWMGA